MELNQVKQVPILDIASRLGIQVKGKKALCFSGHDKRSPSLTFSPSKNTWRCYGACGKSGDGISLVMAVLDYDFKTALAWLANEFRVDVGLVRSKCCNNGGRHATRTHQQLYPVTPIQHDKAKKFIADPEIYTWLIGKCGLVSHPIGLKYLVEHGISMDVANRFCIRELCDPERAFKKTVECWGAERVFRSGLAWEKNGIPDRLIWSSYSIIFPIYLNASIAFLQGRLFKGKAKYLGLCGVPKPLFNIDSLHTLSSGSIVHICEGIPDALALAAHGLHAVAVLGASSFRAEWVDLFMKYDIVLMPDGDQGGDTFKRKITEFFRVRGKAVRSVHVPNGMDVADVIAAINVNK